MTLEGESVVFHFVVAGDEALPIAWCGAITMVGFNQPKTPLLSSSEGGGGR